MTDDESEEAMPPMQNVVRFPRDHVRKISRNARELARQQGHELGRWLPPSKGWPWMRYADCVECGAWAALSTKSINYQKIGDHIEGRGLTVLQEDASPFLTNEPSIEGDALLYACPAPDAPHHPRYPGRLGPEGSAKRQAAIARKPRADW
jgi:hypothetical protein